MQPSPIAHRPEVLACPVCHGALASHAGGNAACRTCGLVYPRQDGVFLLGPPFEVNGVQPAFGTPRMQRLLADSMECGWKDAQKRFSSEVLGGGLKGPRASRLQRARAKLAGNTWEDTLHDMVDPTRAGWKFLLDLRPSAQVLFLGPSWGAAPLGLARSVDQVVVLDGAVERLRLMQQQAHGEDVHNLTFARVIDPVHLPLADGSVDLAVIPGLAEWFVAVAGHRPVPPNCGTELLRELRRVLSPRGQAFLAADNRRGLAWLVASRWLPGASYSPTALRRAAAEAGFEGCSLFAPLPFRHKFHQIVDVDRTDRMNFSIDAYRTRGRMTRPLVKAWDVINKRGALERMLYPYLPGLSAVVSVDAKPRAFVDRIVQHLANEGRIANPPPSLSGYHVRPKGAAVLTAGVAGNGGLVVRLPMVAGAAATCALHHRSLTVMAKDERIPADVRRLFPAPIAEGTFEGQTFFAETSVGGESGRRYYSRSVKRYDRAISSAAEVLRKLRRATEVPVRIDEEQFDRLCGNWLTELMTIVPEENRAALESVERYLRETMLGQVLPLGWYHGDYDFANLLYGKDDAVSGVLDFEVFDAQGLPLMDLIVLLARRDIRRQGMAFGTLVARMIKGLALPPLEAGLLETEMRATGADARQYRAMALCCWLNHLRLRRDSWLVRSPEWLHENFHAVVESVRSIL